MNVLQQQIFILHGNLADKIPNNDIIATQIDPYCNQLDKLITFQVTVYYVVNQINQSCINHILKIVKMLKSK